MIEREREEVVLRILRTDRFVSVTDAVTITGASEATIRRDFARLEEQGLIQRVRGGAEYLTNGSSPADDRASHAAARRGNSTRGRSLSERGGVQTEHKRRIARRAAAYCRDGDTVLIEGGSTTLLLADYLLTVRITVVTNSFAVADRLRQSECAQVFLPGGRLEPESMLIQDPTGRDFYQDYAANYAFLGAEGIDEGGLTNTDMEIVHNQRRMMAQAKQVVVLADSSKFAAVGHLRTCGFDRIDVLVTNEKPPEAIGHALETHGVEVVVVLS